MPLSYWNIDNSWNIYMIKQAEFKEQAQIAINIHNKKNPKTQPL